MTTSTTAHTARRRWQRSLGIGLGLLLALLAITFLTLPPARRLLANPAGQAAVAGVSTIEVLGDSFQNHIYAPPVVRVPAGTTVTWAFNDRGASGDGEPVPHNVVGDGWGSAVLAEGSFQQTFSAPGVYPYTCTLHPGMDGVVEVVAQ
jgi:plastocyanin